MYVFHQISTLYRNMAAIIKCEKLFSHFQRLPSQSSLNFNLGLKVHLHEGFKLQDVHTVQCIWTSASTTKCVCCPLRFNCSHTQQHKNISTSCTWLYMYHMYTPKKCMHNMNWTCPFRNFICCPLRVYNYPNFSTRQQIKYKQTHEGRI